MKNRTTESLPLEGYIDFYSDPWRSSTSLAHLKRIIAMHGFQQLYNRPKRQYVECLASIKLMPPFRSTLQEGVSFSFPAFLMADEVASDLADLGWHECQIRSIVTFDPRSHSQADCGRDLESPAANDGAFPSSASPRRSERVQRIRARPADFVVSGKRPRSKRRCISTNALAGMASASYPAVAASAAPSEATPHEEAASHSTWSPIHVTVPPNSPYLSSPPNSPYLSSPPSSSSWTMSSASSSRLLPLRLSPGFREKKKKKDEISSTRS